LFRASADEVRPWTPYPWTRKVVPRERG